MENYIRNIVDWIAEDWQDNPPRFCVEVLCWLNSIVTSIIFNSTVPNIPFNLTYPMWIAGTLAYAWCAYSRGSFGMLITFCMLASMDVVGYAKFLLN